MSLLEKGEAAWEAPGEAPEKLLGKAPWEAPGEAPGEARGKLTIYAEMSTKKGLKTFSVRVFCWD